MAQCYPIELIQMITLKINIILNMRILMRADLWNGNPDIDSINRLSLKLILSLKNNYFYSSNKISPFNSQNTFIKSDVLKHYFMFLI